MYQIVDIGGQSVPMLAMASVDLYYKRIFHEDPIKLQAQPGFSEDTVAQIELYMRMGFIMAKYAEVRASANMAKLTEDSFIEWLEQFDRGALYDALQDIGKVYNGQKVGSSAEKNPESRQVAE